MKARHQRAFIALDEWLGILVAVYLHSTGSSLFWYFVIPWAIAIYAISYPLHWRAERKRRRWRRACRLHTWGNGEGPHPDREPAT